MTDFFWAFFGRLLIKPVVIICLAVILIVEAYYLLAPARDPIPAARHKVAESVCEKVVLELPKRSGSPSIAVLDLAGDVNGIVTGMLRQKIVSAGEYEMIENKFFGKLIKEFGIGKTPVSRLADAVTAARQLGVDVVLFGEVAEFTNSQKGVNLTLELRMAERQSGQAIFARSYSESTTSSWRLSLSERPWARKIFIWFLFTLILPLASIPLIRRVTELDSNMCNLALLGIYTIADMLVAFLLMGFVIEGILSVALLVLALAASVVYNYSVASFVEQMEH